MARAAPRTLADKAPCRASNPRYNEVMLPSPQLPLTLDSVRASGRFITGVVATPEDVASYKAVFSGAPNARPLEIDVPQYAMFQDKETGERSLYIVTQAEEGNEYRFIGAFGVTDGRELVGFESDFQFLGQVPPS
jgi:hypothetical protein